MTVADSKRALARAMTEDQLKDAVLGAAALHGWLVHHDRPARARRGGEERYETAIEGDAGFVDLVLAHPRHGVLFRELKTERGSLSDDQRAWLDALSGSGRADVGVWRPEDWISGLIDVELQGKHRGDRLPAIHVNMGPARTFEQGYAAGLADGGALLGRP